MIQNIFYTGINLPKYELNSHLECHIYHTPTITVDFIEPDSCRSVEQYLNQGSVIIFLSKNGVHGFNRWLKKINLDFDHFQNRIVVVGAETANEIKSIFNRDSDYPDTQNSIGLSSILQKFKNKRAVLITGARTRPELPNWLSRNKWDVLSLVVYQTRIFKNRGLNSKFRNDRNDAVIFSSPSTVMGFLQSTNYSDLSSIQSRLLSIGKTTSKTVIEHNGNVYYEAITPSGELLISEALKMLNDTPINV